MQHRDGDQADATSAEAASVERIPLHSGILSGAGTAEEVTNHVNETSSANTEAPARIGSVGGDESTAAAITGDD